MKKKVVEYICETAEKTIEFGVTIGNALQKGAVISLDGPLGAGKTTMVKGIAKGLVIDDEITSPTFTIISEYSGKFKLHHIDMYRIESDEELEYLGLYEIIYGDGISIIEWGEKIKEYLPENTISINIELMDNGARKITIKDFEF